MRSVDLSVVMPNYNHARYLPRALDAIVSQSVRPREVLVIDDASTDDSVRVLEGYARRYPFVRLVRNERNLGCMPTCNRGIGLTAGAYLHFPGADDYIRPGFYEKATALLDRHPSAGLCSAYDSYTVGDGPLEPNPSGWAGAPGYFTPDEVCQRLRHVIPGHATVIRREALVRARGFLPELEWYADWFTLVTIAFRHGACHLPETLAVRVLLPGAYSTEAAQSEKNVRVLGAFFDRITSADFADVAPYFRRNGAATFFGLGLLRAAAKRPDRWAPEVLGFLNGFSAEQYQEALADPDPAVREIATFFLGPFWKESVARRRELEAEVLRLREELEFTRQQVPPPGPAGKLRWIAGMVKRRLRKALRLPATRTG